MNRLIWLILVAGLAVQAVFAQTSKPAVISKPGIETDYILDSTKNLALDFLVLHRTVNGKILPKNSRIDDSDMVEIVSRLVWVLVGKTLPEEARLRTNARANSPASDKIPFVDDLAPTKRLLSFLTSTLNDRNIADETISKLQVEVKELRSTLDGVISGKIPLPKH